VTRTASPAPMQSGSEDGLRSSSTSTPILVTPVAAAASTESPARTPSATPAPTEIACPACTFLNHPSLTSCEICSTPLPKRRATRPERQQSAPTPDSPSTNANPSSGKMDVTRLSFRKGGSSEAYRRLKNVLSDKAWERVSGAWGNTGAGRQGAHC
jgi:ESCRT-II complex subunit VPS36